MPYYKTCPNCGANLDPCEICDCAKEKAACAATQNGKPEGATSSKSIIHKGAGNVKRNA